MLLWAVLVSKALCRYWPAVCEYLRPMIRKVAKGAAPRTGMVGNRVLFYTAQRDRWQMVVAQSPTVACSDCLFNALFSGQIALNVCKITERKWA